MTNLEELKRQGDLERVKAEAQARADAERQNEDIALRSLRVSSTLVRQRLSTKGSWGISCRHITIYLPLSIYSGTSRRRS